jgi:hypothetical protein
MTVVTPSSSPPSLPRTRGDDLPPLAASLIWPELAAGWLVAAAAFAALWLG